MPTVVVVIVTVVVVVVNVVVVIVVVVVCRAGGSFASRSPRILLHMDELFHQTETELTWRFWRFPEENHQTVRGCDHWRW